MFLQIGLTEGISQHAPVFGSYSTFSELLGFPLNKTQTPNPEINIYLVKLVYMKHVNMLISILTKSNFSYFNFKWKYFVHCTCTL